ncbi:transposon Tf2-9 polyprotein [Trichonephila clavipes]|nr:transposon Tf2-9 polyprotein [Trichonephila clavipes]
MNETTQLVSRNETTDRWMIRWALKLSEFNIKEEHRPGVQNVVADLLSRNPVDSVEGSQISCAALRALAITSREQLIREQREDPELGHIYRYLENPDDGSVNATVCEGWSQDFQVNKWSLLREVFSTLGELRVYIPGSLRKDIMKEFHDLPLAGHLGKRKTYLKLRDTCYFPFLRKYIFEYVSTCDRCQKFNYKNAVPAGRLMPIVSKYPNEIVTLDLLGPYPASQPERYKFILGISDHFTKWCELIPLRKASAQVIANAFFDNYIARYGAPISLISDNGPQFISDVFEHLSHRFGIKHMKTVTYRPQANLTERVNRNLVQMIASFVEENHENWEHCARRLPDRRWSESTTVGSRTEGSGRDNQTHQTRATMRGRKAEKPVRSNQATTRRPCPYYLRSRVKESDGIPEEQRNIEINGIPHSEIRRRSLSMEALDGDSVHRRI